MVDSKLFFRPLFDLTSLPCTKIMADSKNKTTRPQEEARSPWG